MESPIRSRLDAAVPVSFASSSVAISHGWGCTPSPVTIAPEFEVSLAEQVCAANSRRSSWPSREVASLCQVVQEVPTKRDGSALSGVSLWP